MSPLPIYILTFKIVCLHLQPRLAQSPPMPSLSHPERQLCSFYCHIIFHVWIWCISRVRPWMGIWVASTVKVLGMGASVSVPVQISVWTWTLILLGRRFL